MARYTFNPSTLPTGNYVPSGWSEVGLTGKTSISDEHTFGRSMRVEGQNTVDFDGMVRWDTVGSVSRPIEIYMILSWEGLDVADPGAVFCVDTSTWSGYKGLISDRSNVVRFYSIINGYFTVLGNATINAPAIGEVWHLLIQALSDGTLRAKAWRNGESEPASWLLSLTDSTFSSGVLGVEIQRFGTCYYFWIGVGTAGDSAPRPFSPNTYNESVSMNVSASAVASNVLAAAESVATIATAASYNGATAEAVSSLTILSAALVSDSVLASISELLSILSQKGLSASSQLSILHSLAYAAMGSVLAVENAAFVEAVSALLSKGLSSSSQLSILQSLAHAAMGSVSAVENAAFVEAVGVLLSKGVAESNAIVAAQNVFYALQKAFEVASELIVNEGGNYAATAQIFASTGLLDAVLFSTIKSLAVSASANSSVSLVATASVQSVSSSTATVNVNHVFRAVADLLASFFVVMGAPTYNARRFIRLKETRNVTYG
jgi:hypothetical protein